MKNILKLQFLVLILILILQACSNSSTRTIPPESQQPEFIFSETTITKIHQAIQIGSINCNQIIEHYIDRINQYDQSSKINSIILINPNAIEKSKLFDKQFAENSELKSLQCIPVVLKDNFDTADMPTEAGSIAMKGSIPPDDAFMVKQLRNAGAIIIAKSNMAEWAFSPYDTVSTTRGITANAYDTSRVPAGSSGGTASAIAANFGVIGMGTDTGNSIRGPASHLSLIGIRSTIGMTSRDGVIPLLLNRDIAGPLVRTVEDAAITFSIIAGYDEADDSTLPAKIHMKNDYTRYLLKDGLQNIKLGVLREIYNEESADPEVIALFNQAIEDLKGAGAIIIDPFGIENFDQLTKATGFCSRFRFDLNNYLTSLGDAAPVKNLKEIVDNKQFDPRNAGAMQWAMSVNIPPDQMQPPCVDVAGDPRRKALLDAVLSAMQTNNIDAIIYPSWSNPPRKIGDTESPHGNNSPIIAPHTGQPAITIPMGYTKNGLPTGLQILGRPFDEANLFTFAYAYEQATLHRHAADLN